MSDRDYEQIRVNLGCVVEEASASLKDATRMRAKLNVANVQIESLQRENAALRDVLDRRGNLSKYVDSGNLLAEQKATAITPEVREKLNECIAGYRISGTDGNRKYWAVELISVVRGLLEEQE